MFDALLLLVGEPREIDVPSEEPSLLTHAFLLAALVLLVAAIVIVWKHGLQLTAQ